MLLTKLINNLIIKNLVKDALKAVESFKAKEHKK